MTYFSPAVHDTEVNIYKLNMGETFNMQSNDST